MDVANMYKETYGIWYSMIYINNEVIISELP